MPRALIALAHIGCVFVWVAITIAPHALPPRAHATAAIVDSADVQRATAGPTIRGWPYPESRYFLLFSAGYMAPVAGPDHLPDDPGGKLALEFGMMVNIDHRWAIGVSGHLESDGDFEETFGALVRLRRWLTRSTCLDAGIGWLTPTTDEMDLLATETQFTALVELQHSNWISVFVQMETLEFVPEFSGWVAPPPSHGTVWYVGGRGHYLPGLLALVGALVLATSSGS